MPDSPSTICQRDTAHTAHQNWVCTATVAPGESGMASASHRLLKRGRQRGRGACYFCVLCRVKEQGVSERMVGGGVGGELVAEEDGSMLVEDGEEMKACDQRTSW